MMTESDVTSPTSPALEDFCPKKMEDKINYRKSNKPLMEKKRRARINSCLVQLKALVLEAMKKDNSQYSKLEKADILELTVKHLKNVQKYQGHSVSHIPDAISKYRAGFNECANEVMRYLSDTHGVNQEARSRILTHLASILTPLNNLHLQQGHSPILPATQLQQKHQQSIFLAPAPQVPANDGINNSCSAPGYHHPRHMGNVLDIKNIADSPTAFQVPVSAGLNIQIPCVNASTATVGTAQFHLLPSNPGQVALVLTPQTIPTLNMYTSQQVSTQQMISGQANQGDAKRLDAFQQPALTMKSSRSSRLDRSLAAPYKRPVSPPANEPMSTTSCPLTFDLKQSYSLSKVSPKDVVTITGQDKNDRTGNVVRATSTWRPW